jgi:hypothetical protein
MKYDNFISQDENYPAYIDTTCILCVFQTCFLLDITLHLKYMYLLNLDSVLRQDTSENTEIMFHCSEN